MSEVFAIYSVDDNSLNFYKRETLPDIGDTYNDLTVSAIYKEFEDVECENQTHVPWASVRGNIESVKFNDVISPVSLAHWFYYFTSLTSFSATNLDLSNCNSLFYTFYHCENIESIDFTGVDTSQVQTCERAFYGCYALETLTLGRFDTSSLEHTDFMFYGCSSLTAINVKVGSDWNVDLVSTSESMFEGCELLDGYSDGNTDIAFANTDTGYFTGVVIIECTPTSIIYTGENLIHDLVITVSAEEELAGDVDYTLSFYTEDGEETSEIIDAGNYVIEAVSIDNNENTEDSEGLDDGSNDDGTGDDDTEDDGDGDGTEDEPNEPSELWTATCTICVTKTPIEQTNINITTVFEYDPTAPIDLELEITYEGMTLVKNTNYKLSRDSVPNAPGVYELVITGVGNFAGIAVYQIRVLSPTKNEHAVDAGIQVGNTHSYKDFHAKLIAKGVAAPVRRTAFVDEIPFMNGFYDFSDLYGQPFYTYRTASYVFRMYQDRDRLHDFIDWLHHIVNDNIYDPSETYWHLIGSIESVDVQDAPLLHYAEITATFRCQPHWVSNEEQTAELVEGENYVTNAGEATPLYAKSNEDSAVSIIINGLGQSVYSKTQLLFDLPSGATLVESSGAATLYFSDRKL